MRPALLPSGFFFDLKKAVATKPGPAAGIARN
jgi:hypothetical protein